MLCFRHCILAQPVNRGALLRPASVRASCGVRPAPGHGQAHENACARAGMSGLGTLHVFFSKYFSLLVMSTNGKIKPCWCKTIPQSRRGRGKELHHSWFELGCKHVCVTVSGLSSSGNADLHTDVGTCQVLAHSGPLKIKCAFSSCPGAVEDPGQFRTLSVAWPIGIPHFKV